MTDKKRKKTLLEIEFELLVQDLKNSGLKVNENHREEIPLNRTFVTFISKIKSPNNNRIRTSFRCN